MKRKRETHWQFISSHEDAIDANYRELAPVSLACRQHPEIWKYRGKPDNLRVAETVA